VNALKIMPGESTAIEGQNAILVRANPETFAEISKRVEEIDVPQKQIEIRARLIEISVSEAEKYGIDWSKLNKLTTILAEDAKSSIGTGLPYMEQLHQYVFQLLHHLTSLMILVILHTEIFHLSVRFRKINIFKESKIWKISVTSVVS